MQTLIVSCGDPAGIGPELAIKAWIARDDHVIPPFCLLIDPKIIQERARHFGLDIKIALDDRHAFNKALPIIPLQHNQTATLGQPDPHNAPSILEAIEYGVSLIKQRIGSALITLPIAKKTLYEAGFAFPGHTEFLAHLAAKLYPATFYKPVMLLAGPHLKTVPITIHIPLACVTKQLNQARIIETAQIVAHDLQTRFGFQRPRLAVCGLNPHAGEGGAFGKEDLEIIAPAVQALQKQGLDVSGPWPADTLFHAQARRNYDVALCMYHDQALIPVKTIGFDETVNVTLGLPFIRTSPDHGTAFDIADKGIASPQSFIAALKLAKKLVENSAKTVL